MPTNLTGRIEVVADCEIAGGLGDKEGKPVTYDLSAPSDLESGFLRPQP